MPIRINELHIKVNIDEKKKRDDRQSPAKAEQSNEMMIQACVEQVLEAIERKNSR